MNEGSAGLAERLSSFTDRIRTQFRSLFKDLREVEERPMRLLFPDTELETVEWKSIQYPESSVPSLGKALLDYWCLRSRNISRVVGLQLEFFPRFPSSLAGVEEYLAEFDLLTDQIKDIVLQQIENGEWTRVTLSEDQPKDDGLYVTWTFKAIIY